MNKVVKLVFVVVILLSSDCLLFSQAVTWQKWYDYNNYNSDGKDAIQTFDGGFILLTNNYVPLNYSTVLIKTNYLGDIEWEKLIDKTNTGGAGILSYSIQQSKDSGFVICGDSGGDSALLIKTNKTGQIQWFKKYTRTGMIARFLDLKITLDGGIIACGFLYPPDGGYVVKANNLGNVEWDSAYLFPVGKIIESTDSNFYMLGGEASLTKIDKLGKFIWSKNFCCATRNLIKDNSGFIFTGGGNDSMILTKFDTSGMIVFQKGYFNGVHGSRTMCLSRDGNILIAGVMDTLSQTNIAVVKIDVVGNQIYSKKIISILGGIYAFLPRAVNSTNDSGFIFTGFTDYPGFPFGENVLAVKTDSVCYASLIVNVYGNNTNVPEKFILYQNHPNPFNPITTINYEVAKSELIKLKVYSITGSEICTLVDEFKYAGKYTALFNAQKYNLASGIYIYKLGGMNFSISKKMLLLK